MKKRISLELASCIVIVVLLIFIKNGHINLPGHGNRENQNLEKAVMNYVSSSLTKGETVKFESKYLCEDYKENNEIRFSANVVYYIISKDGTEERRIAHVICNEDKNRIIEWKDIAND